MASESNLHSIATHGPASGDRRDSERHLTLFRVGSCCIDGRHELCLVKDISAGGVMIHTYSPLSVGQRVEVEIREGQQVAGTVTWVSGHDTGVTFDERADIEALLSQGAGSTRKRMPRVGVDCIGFVRAGAIIHRAKIRNISQGGVGVDIPRALTVGAPVSVRLPGLDPRMGTVRWVDSDRHGISFNSLIGLSTLADWVRRQQPDPTVAGAMQPD